MASPEGRTAPASFGENVQLDTDLYYRALYIGGAGDIKVDVRDGGTGIVFKNTQAGSILVVEVSKVYTSGTTATDLIGLR